MRFLLDDNLETKVLRARDRIDLRRVDDLRHGDDFDRRVLLVVFVERKTLRTQDGPQPFPLTDAGLDAQTLQIAVADDLLWIAGDAEVEVPVHRRQVGGWLFDGFEGGDIVE